MGALDQWLKAVLADETPTLTAHAAVFKVAPEIRTTELQPDGLLRTTTPGALRHLAPPWSLLEHEAVIEGKMPGDKLGPDALQRLCFRREARQAQRFKDAEKDERALNPDPTHCAGWMLSPHLPRWLRAWERLGRVTLVSAGTGCWWVQPALFPLLWVAANELPLREELIPFLTARTGRKLHAFFDWVQPRRPPAWIAELVYAQPEVGVALLRRARAGQAQPLRMPTRVGAGLAPPCLRRRRATPTRGRPDVHPRRQGFPRGAWAATWRTVAGETQVKRKGKLSKLLKFFVWGKVGECADLKGIPALSCRACPEEHERGLAALRRSPYGKWMREEGRNEGLGPVEHQFARRLGRVISEAERAELLRRLDTLGPARIGDVVLDLAPDALATWLADPNAT